MLGITTELNNTSYHRPFVRMHATDRGQFRIGGYSQLDRPLLSETHGSGWFIIVAPFSHFFPTLHCTERTIRPCMYRCQQQRPALPVLHERCCVGRNAPTVYSFASQDRMLVAFAGASVSALDVSITSRRKELNNLILCHVIVGRGNRKRKGLDHTMRLRRAFAVYVG
jgi:hypothetical protein